MAISRVRDRRDLADHVPAGPEPRARSTRSGGSVTDAVQPAGRRSRRARRRRPPCRRRPRHGHRAEDAAAPGRRRAARADRRSRPTQVPTGAKQAVDAARRSRATSSASSGATSSPAAATPGKVEKGELGLPGVTVAAARRDGQDGRSRRRRADDGTFDFTNVAGRAPTTPAIGAADVRQAVGRLRLARPEADHAGADDRLHLDLGRLRDGRDRAPASRRCRATCSRRRAPTARPSGRCSAASPCRCSRRCSRVVFITMIINVLKVFDIVIALAPGRRRTTRT